MRIGYIYKIYCLDDNIKECYIGSSFNIKKRMRCHKHSCSTINCPKYNYKLYTFIRDNGNWSNWDYQYYIVNVIDKTDLKMQEQDRMDIEINPILNGMRAYTDKLEYNKQKHNCPCGGRYIITHKIRHFRTLKHQNYINQV